MSRPFLCGLAVGTAGVVALSGAGYCAGELPPPVQRGQPSTSPAEAQPSTSPPPAQLSTSPTEAQPSTSPPPAQLSTSPAEAQLSTSPAEAQSSTSPAEAQSSTSPAEAQPYTSPPPAQRVHLLVTEAVESNQRRALEALLAARLEQLGWVLVVASETRTPREWLDSMEVEGAAIGVVIAANPQDWLLYLVDVERQLAVRRSLTGARDDAAAAEAVASIVVSAAESFHWGGPAGGEAVPSALSDVLEPPPERAQLRKPGPEASEAAASGFEPSTSARWALAFGGEVRSWVGAERFSAGPQLQVLLEHARRGDSRAKPGAEPVAASSGRLRTGIGAGAFASLALAPLWAVRISLQGNYWLSSTRYLASNRAELLTPSRAAMAFTLALCWQLAR